MKTFAKSLLAFSILLIMLAMSSCSHRRPEKARPEFAHPAYLNEATDSFQTVEGRQVYVTLLGHASLLLTIEGHAIYVDPVSQYLSRQDLPQAECIIITHEHPDHFDQQAISRLSGTADVPVIAPENVVQQLGKGQVMHNGDSIAWPNGMQVRAVAAYNTTPDHLKYHPKGTGNGYVISLDGLHIYIAGDTEPIPEMRKLGEIDVAFLPVNQPYTMTPAQAREAALAIKPAILYPYHFSQTPVGQITKALGQIGGTELRMRAMQ